MSFYSDPSVLIANDPPCRVRSLSIVLQDVEVKASGGELEETQETKLAEIMKSCMQVLTDVETMTTKYKLSDESNVRPHKKIIRTFKMLTWEPAEISDLRDRIASNVMLLNTFLTILSGYLCPQSQVIGKANIQ